MALKKNAEILARIMRLTRCFENVYKDTVCLKNSPIDTLGVGHDAERKCESNQNHHLRVCRLPPPMSQIDEVKKINVTVVIDRVAVETVKRMPRLLRILDVRVSPGVTTPLDPEGLGSCECYGVKPLEASVMGNDYITVQDCKNIILDEMCSNIRCQKYLIELSTSYIMMGFFLRQCP